MAPSQDRNEYTPSSENRPTQRTCLLIAGMHRSGTSALARVLSLLGADLPRTLMDGTDANKASNATGHWESEAAARLGDMVLDSAGTDWRSPEPVAASWYHSARYPEMRDRAVELLHSEFGQSPLFVFKDPRVCKLMPFWLDALEHFGVAPRVISILRGPVEVAASLNARNGLDLAIGQLLWLRYVLDAEAASRSTSRVFVTYDQLLQNSGDVTSRIAAALNLVWPRNSLKADNAIASFLSTSHRHHTRETDRINASQRGFFPLLADVEGIFLRWAAEGEDSGQHPTLDRSREELDRALALLGEPVALALHQGSQLRRFKSHDKEREAQLKTVEQSARLSEEKAKAAEARVSGLVDADRRYSRALSELENVKKHVTAVETARGKAIQDAQDARVANARLEERATATEMGRAAAVSLCERLERQLEEIRQGREALLIQLHISQMDQVRSEAKITALEGEIKSLADAAQELDKVRVKLSQIEQDCAREASHASASSRMLEARSRQLEALRVEHGRSAEAQKIMTSELAALRRENDVAARTIAKQKRIAAERQAAIEHLREDRSRKVAERDEKYRKLEMRVAALQSQLSVTHASYPAPSLPSRVGRWLRLPGALAAQRRAGQLQELRSAELFDGWWYLAKYEDVRNQGLDAAEHYLDHGGVEGRSPGPEFDGRWYLEANPDVREAGVNPLLHFLEHGRAEGREKRSLSVSRRQRHLIGGPAPMGRSLAPAARNENSVDVNSSSGAHVKLSNQVPDARTSAFGRLEGEAVEGENHDGGRQTRWSSRRLSFSALSVFADLDRHVKGSVSATNAEDVAPLFMGDNLVAQGTNLAAKPDALAALRWGDWLGRMATRADADAAPADLLADAMRIELCDGELTLEDAWFGSLDELHVRFRARSGIAAPVLRGFQPDDAGCWVNCGEAAISGAGETHAKLQMQSRFAPLLLLLVDDAGYLVDSTLLAFPSIYRGGPHYGELVGLGDGGLISAARDHALDLVGKLVATARGGGMAISSIEVNVDGANGTEPGLDSGLLSWLVNDLGIAVSVHAEILGEPSTGAIEAEVAQLGSPAKSRPQGACLELPARAIPTLAALFAASGELIEGAARAIYMDGGTGHAAYGLDCSQPAIRIDHLVPVRAASLPAIREGSAAATACAVKAVDLAICWPASHTSAEQAFFPSGAMGFPELSKMPRRLSILIDATDGVADLTALLVSLENLSGDFEIVSIVICRAPGAPTVSVKPFGNFGAKVRFVTVMGRAGPQQADEVIRAGGESECAERVFLLHETVVLHDPRVAEALWNACDVEGVGSASCVLVSDLITAKGVKEVRRTVGWITVRRGDGPLSFVLQDLGYELPAVLTLAAPDLRCSMVDRTSLAFADDAEIDDLAFGLRLGRAGLAHICLNFVAAATSHSRIEEVQIDKAQQQDGVVPRGVLEIRSFRQ